MDKLKFYFFAFFVIIVLGWWFLNFAEGFLGNYYSGPVEHALNTVDLASLTTAQLKSYITQGYGTTLFSSLSAGYIQPWHNGVDIIANYGAAILSPDSGMVFMTGNQDNYCNGKGYGKFVVVNDASDGHALLYAHLSRISVAVGEKIKTRDTIGLVGKTGFATGTHLHFTVFEPGSVYIGSNNGCGPDPKGKDMNPLTYLDSIKK
ncbi:MAG: M23 family metallopeptidase [Patescibacteria group bacterium]|nr:M23 family metallopeptidase [Patescibacteria group bacterium]MDE2015723.1 M23 family metallopeptidase [Patescibacteria group bacterium]MDE2226781.1 M23 family metallopeptidase [Patescibacteria group bacterium]